MKEYMYIMKRMIKVLLSSIFCLFILAGCSSSPYSKTKVEPQTLTIQGVPVYVEPNDELTQIEVDKHLKAIEEQPGYLMKNCTGIHLQGENLFREEGRDVSDSGAYTSIKEIYIDGKTDFGIGKKTEDIIKNDITHELWHAFDYTYGNSEYHLSELDFNFNALYNQAPESITDYGATDVCEFFAEAGMMYVNEPDKLKEKNIDVFNYFEALPKE